MYNRRRLFVASCAAIFTNAVAFSIRTDILGDFERAFSMNKADVGKAIGWGGIGGIVVQFLGGALLDYVGIGKVLWLAVAAHLTGLTLTIVAWDFWSLAVAWLFMALAGGLIEASVNPLAATMYPDKKTHAMNVLHAWWPGGLILGGLLAVGFSQLSRAAEASGVLSSHLWQIKMALPYASVAVYAFLIAGQKFPQTERMQAGVPARMMLREALRPAFLMLVFCMLLTASVELGPNSWVGVFIQDIVGFPGVLVLVYTSGLMFVLRYFAGPVAKRISPMGILLASSVLSGLGLLWLSYAGDRFTVFLAATVWGVGVTYYWPTMLGVTAERFPRGGAFLLGILGGAAGLFLSYVTFPGMGWLHDHYTLKNIPSALAPKIVKEGHIDDTLVVALVSGLPADEKQAVEKAVEQAKRTGASMSFRWVAALAAVLIVLFGGMTAYDRARSARNRSQQPAPPTTASPPPAG